MPKTVYEQIEKVVIQENEKEVKEKQEKDAKKDEGKKKSDSDAGDPLKVPSLDVSSMKPLEKSVSSPRLGKPTPEKEEVSAPSEKKEKGKEKEKEKEKAPLRKKDIEEMVSQSSLSYRCFLFVFTCGYLSKIRAKPYAIRYGC